MVYNLNDYYKILINKTTNYYITYAHQTVKNIHEYIIIIPLTLVNIKANCHFAATKGGLDWKQ